MPTALRGILRNTPRTPALPTREPEAVVPVMSPDGMTGCQSVFETAWKEYAAALPGSMRSKVFARLRAAGSSEARRHKVLAEMSRDKVAARAELRQRVTEADAALRAGSRPQPNAGSLDELVEEASARLGDTDDNPEVLAQHVQTLAVSSPQLMQDEDNGFTESQREEAEGIIEEEVTIEDGSDDDDDVQMAEVVAVREAPGAPTTTDGAPRVSSRSSEDDGTARALFQERVARASTPSPAAADNRRVQWVSPIAGGARAATEQPTDAVAPANEQYSGDEDDGEEPINALGIDDAMVAEAQAEIDGGHPSGVRPAEQISARPAELSPALRRISGDVRSPRNTHALAYDLGHGGGLGGRPMHPSVHYDIHRIAAEERARQATVEDAELKQGRTAPADVDGRPQTEVMGGRPILPDGDPLDDATGQRQAEVRRRVRSAPRMTTGGAKPAPLPATQLLELLQQTDADQPEVKAAWMSILADALARGGGATAGAGGAAAATLPKSGAAQQGAAEPMATAVQPMSQPRDPRTRPSGQDSFQRALLEAQARGGGASYSSPEELLDNLKWRQEALDSLISSAEPHATSGRKQIHKLLRLIVSIAPAHRRAWSHGRTGDADPIDVLGDVLRDINDDGFAALPRHCRTWDGLKVGMRDRLQLLRVVGEKCRNSGDIDAYSRAMDEFHTVEALWRELEVATAQGKLFAKLRAALDNEIDLLSRGTVSFNISDMVATGGGGAQQLTTPNPTAGNKRARNTHGNGDAGNDATEAGDGAGEPTTRRAKRRARAERLRNGVANRENAGNGANGEQRTA